MNKEDLRVCWGTPDTVYYIDKDNVTHEIDFQPYGYAFGIWDGTCIVSSDNDDTCGMIHDDLIVWYVWEHGWGDILAPKDVFDGVDSCDMCDKKVVHDGEEDKIIPRSISYIPCEDEGYYNLIITDLDDNEEEFEEYDKYDMEDILSDEIIDDITYYDSGEEDENGWKVLTYDDRETYGDLLERLGSPVLRGRILMDFEVDLYNPPAFIAIWDEEDITQQNIKKLEYAWGKDIYNYFLVTESNEQSATRYGIFNMPTLREWMNGETNYNGKKDAEEKERFKCLHLMVPEEKWKNMKGWRDAHNKIMNDKLSYRDHDGNIRTDIEPMTLAQYHNMIYQENIKKQFWDMMNKLNEIFQRNKQDIYE